MSGSEAPLRLFLDRSTQGRRFVDAVRELVSDVETINDRYGTKPAESVPDTTWIAEASADNRILVGADRNILRNPLERRAICLAGARYVVFGNNNIPMRTMIERFEHHLPRIIELTSVSGPWVYRIAQHGIERLKLNCAPGTWGVR
ncbi:hypothetical protein [Amycolatopsis palatopharyngis]|uniref:PIN-like domain-containing protein n=1 Tax=Amycolatopsis palatopharyngis TaxID=187982 RepID=UPI000E24AA99|nr:hypothetical protein [Amycolatopsis palatopharyngis]